MRRFRRLVRWVLATIVLVCVGTAQAVVPVGKPLLIELPKEVLARAVGANGFVVVGGLYNGGGFHWMPTSGVSKVGGTQTVSASRDGKTIAGNSLDGRGLENAAIWTGGTSWRLLGSITPSAQPCDLLLSATFGANGDGKVVVGLAWDGCRIARAFRWEESTGVVSLGSLSGESTRANAISGNGRVVIGWEQAVGGFRQAAKWVDGKEELIRGPSGTTGEAFSTNWNGSIIAGTGCDPAASVGPPTGWIWTQASGTKCLRVERPRWALNLPYQVLPESMSDDGRVIGGALSFGLDAESVIWFDGEPVMLRDYLRQNGIPDAFLGWVNTGFILGVSPDGGTLVGYGAGPTGFQGFVVILPELGDKK